jgi:hypothetical protein
MSTPSARQNPLNRQKTQEKELPCKWHSSYAPTDKIEDVEIKKARSPASTLGFFSFSPAPKSPQPQPSSLLERNI